MTYIQKTASIENITHAIVTDAVAEELNISVSTDDVETQQHRFDYLDEYEQLCEFISSAEHQVLMEQIEEALRSELSDYYSNQCDEELAAVIEDQLEPPLDEFDNDESTFICPFCRLFCFPIPISPQ